MIPTKELISDSEPARWRAGCGTAGNGHTNPARSESESEISSLRGRPMVLEILQKHRPTDAKEREDLSRMLTLAQTLAHPFSRDQRVAHFTASAIVIDASGERTCLVHHRKLNRWLQPGGHFEDSDAGDAVRAALREVREETGCDAALVEGCTAPLDVDIHEIPAHGSVPAHLHLDLRFLVRARTDAIAHDSNESYGARWLSWAEALELADDASLLRSLHKARKASESREFPR
jgi:8-oxo-dGTP pyrophosphatase MutT (NUDIX family)